MSLLFFVNVITLCIKLISIVGQLKILLNGLSQTFSFQYKSWLLSILANYCMLALHMHLHDQKRRNHEYFFHHVHEIL